MKKRIPVIASFLLLSTVCQAHPVHVSVVNLYIEDLTLKITVSTFVDDWETAYFHYYGKKTNLKDPEYLNSDWFNNYLAHSIKIHPSKESKAYKLIRDTVYFDQLSMKIEMHAKLTESPKSLYIYNAILTDIFADQTNLLIFSYEKKERGIKFDFHTREKELNLR